MMADKIFKTSSGEFRGGFNSRIHGKTEIGQYDKGESYYGWQAAEDMIKDGSVYYVQPFPHSNCTGAAFYYGALFACNTCQRDHLEKPWWSIRVFKDGNAWCCVGEDFKDLQESENYSFGDTRDQAIKNYGFLMQNPQSIIEQVGKA